MFLCAGAQVASYMITLADLPNVLAAGWARWCKARAADGRDDARAGAGRHRLDLTPTILIFAPVMLPIAVKAGIDPVYFGLMFVLNGPSA
jgi:TRAP-type C4-dicarboxylate transport system permease large subunit